MLEDLEAFYERHQVIREIGIYKRDRRLCAVAVADPAGLRAQGGSTVAEEGEEAVRQQGRALPRYKRLAEVTMAGDALARRLLGKIRRDELEQGFGRGAGGPRGGAEPDAPCGHARGGPCAAGSWGGARRLGRLGRYASVRLTAFRR
ncbi:hypothetical protein [Rhodovulum sp. ES.010]|uniref:hypothetical protein n=1 Tax=Rhodovulum sp. ES.010 TaxID=1882821 RepID=UPI000941A0AA|nr:hypothetical protein [Rhodovulum sp. ES.010]